MDRARDRDVSSGADRNPVERQDDPTERKMPREDKQTAGQAVEDETDFPGLCRICGGTVPPSSDPSSCTPSLCSEECLASALVKYWAARGVRAAVTLRDGFARLESLAADSGARIHP